MAKARCYFRLVRKKITLNSKVKFSTFSFSRGSDVARSWTFRSISWIADEVKICWNEDRQGADVNYCQYPSKLTINGVKMSLLMLAAKKTKLHIVETLINQPRIQIYHRDQNGRNAAHYAIENQD